MWIGRRTDGSVYGAWATEQHEDHFHPNIEEVSETHPDYIAFSNRRKDRIRIDPLSKIAELEQRLQTLESKDETSRV